MEMKLHYNVGEIVNTLINENNKLKLENNELKKDNIDLSEDLEDMKNCYIRNIQELKATYKSLEEEYNEQAREISQLKSQLRSRKTIADELDDYEKWLDSDEADLLTRAYAEMGYM